MPETAESRLKALSIELPAVPAPAANYVPRCGLATFFSSQARCSDRRRREGSSRGWPRPGTVEVARRRRVSAPSTFSPPMKGARWAAPTTWRGAGGETHRFRQLHAGIRGPAQSDQRLLRSHHRRLGRAASTRARPSPGTGIPSSALSRVEVIVEALNHHGYPGWLTATADRPPRLSRCATAGRIENTLVAAARRSLATSGNRMRSPARRPTTGLSSSTMTRFDRLTIATRTSRSARALW